MLLATFTLCFHADLVGNYRKLYLARTKWWVILMESTIHGMVQRTKWWKCAGQLGSQRLSLYLCMIAVIRR